MTTKEIEQKNLEHLIPTKNKKLKKNDKLSNPEETSEWKFPAKSPNEADVKVMFSEIIGFAVNFVMNNHIFVFNGEIYVQQNEGGTGIRLTGVLAEIIMILWCKELAERLIKAGISNQIIPRFVDDITMLPTVIPPGSRLINGKLEHLEEHVFSDIQIEGDKRTMELIKSIADDISESIEVTYDIPSNYTDHKIPVLDLKVGINSESKIEYIFYKKPVANKLVTLKTAASSMKQKMAILTQQCFTRLHNTSNSIDDSIKVSILNDFMKELNASGYSEDDRLNILEGAINTYKKILEKETSGQRPFYRNNEFEKSKRLMNKNSKKSNWYKSGKCENKFATVMFVEATYGDTLLKMLKATEDKYKIADNKRIKFVSKSGTKLENLFKSKNPSKRSCKECAKSGADENLQSNCKTNNVVYQGKCDTCEEKGNTRVYDGETARNLHVRSKEHFADFKNKNQRSWMWKHVEKEHEENTEEVKFSFKVLKKHNKPLQRQIHEAVNISKKKPQENLNSKNEFNYNTNTRLNLEQKKRNAFNCKTCGAMFDTKNIVRQHEDKFHDHKICKVCDYQCFGQTGLNEHMKIKHKNLQND